MLATGLLPVAIQSFVQSSTATAKPPKLRTDLIVSPQETAAGSFFVVKDPAIGRFFRFKAVEYFIAQQLDGQTPLEEVRQRAEVEFDATLEPRTLEQFTAKLSNLGLLESDRVELREAAPGHRRGRFGGSVFYLRFKAFDPATKAGHQVVVRLYQ